MQYRHEMHVFSTGGMVGRSGSEKAWKRRAGLLPEQQYNVRSHVKTADMTGTYGLRDSRLLKAAPATWFRHQASCKPAPESYCANFPKSCAICAICGDEKSDATQLARHKPSCHGPAGFRRCNGQKTESGEARGLVFNFTLLSQMLCTL